MIKAIIVDDEKLMREELVALIREADEDVEVIGEAKSVAEAERLIKRGAPDVIFLDMIMPGENGLELLPKIGDGNYDFIVTTAHNDFALQALKLSAMDYLLKPIDPDELKEAIQKLKAKKTVTNQKTKIELLLQNMDEIVGQRKKIALPSTKGHILLSLSEIIRLQSDGNYTLFFLSNGKKITVSKNLSSYERTLSPIGFFRAHQSHLVNLHHIREYARGAGKTLTMSDGVVVEVSKRNAAALKKALTEMEINNFGD